MGADSARSVARTVCMAEESIPGELRGYVQFQREYGRIRPFQIFDLGARRLVIIDGQLVDVPSDVSNFPTLTSYFLIWLLGEEWFRELGNSTPMHPLAEWFNAARGPHLPLSNLWYQLAYDVFVIRSNANNLDPLVQRLKIKSEFQGARFEIAVAAALILGGYRVTFEFDGSLGPIPELLAVGDGGTFAVEAKSRHRTGVMGFEKANNSLSTPQKAAMRRLLVDALKNRHGHPLLAFIDVNLPRGFDRNTAFKELASTFFRAESRAAPGSFSAIGAVFFNDSGPWDLAENVTLPTDYWLAGMVSKVVDAFDPRVVMTAVNAGLRYRQNIPQTIEQATAGRSSALVRR